MSKPETIAEAVMASRCSRRVWLSKALVLLGAGWLGLPQLAPGAGPRLAGVEYLSMQQVARTFGGRLRWLEPGRKRLLEGTNYRLIFELHKRQMECNGLQVYLGFAVAEAGGELRLSKQDFEATLRPLLTPSRFLPAPVLRRICLDAGHGGKDPGAMVKNPALTEKFLTLDLAQRLERRLTATGWVVQQTRTQDRFVELEERTRLANKGRADLFLSLHFNAAKDSSVGGAECYAITPRGQPSAMRTKLAEEDLKSHPGNRQDPWNLLAAYYVQREIRDRLSVPDRGVRRARFTVLRGLSCPGVLVESGFLTNPAEAARLRRPEYRDSLAEAIGNGLQTCRRAFQRLSPGRPIKRRK